MIRHEEICEKCRAQLDAGDGIDTRDCALCNAMICRHSARKGPLRTEGGKWDPEAIVCKEWAPCVVRTGKRWIK